MFLKTVFLESEARFEMFSDKEFPLKTMYQFSRRVTLYKDGKKMKNSGMIAYAWFGKEVIQVHQQWSECYRYREVFNGKG